MASHRVDPQILYKERRWIYIVLLRYPSITYNFIFLHMNMDSRNVFFSLRSTVTMQLSDYLIIVKIWFNTVNIHFGTYGHKQSELF